MKINKLQILLFFISAILSFSSVAQQNENTETFLGIGSGNRKIAKIQKTPIFPIHTSYYCKEWVIIFMLGVMEQIPKKVIGNP